MSTPLATALILLTGFTFYSVVQSVFNICYCPQRRLHVYFSLMCLFACGYIVIRLFNLHAQSAENLVLGQRLGILLAQLLFLSLIGFVGEYTRWWPKRLIGPLTFALVSLLIINMILPYGLAYSFAPKLQQFSLPWGETVTDTRIRDKTLWWYLLWLSIIVVFLYLFAASLYLRRTNERQRGNTLLWFGGIFFAALIANLLINFNVISFTQVAEFGFIALALMMGLHLNWEARNSRERAESAENTWSSLVMHAPNFILLIDSDGIIRFINHDLGNNRSADIPGNPLATYLHAESRPSLHASLHEVITEKTATSSQLQLASPENTWLDVHLAPMLTTGTIQNIIVMATDITAQVAMRQQLQLSEEKHRQLLQTLPYGVQEVDTQGNIIYSNPAHDQLFGYAPGEMLGMSIFDLPADKQEQDRLRDTIKLILETSPLPETYYERIRHHSGDIRQIKIDWDYKYDEQANVIGLIAILSDITQQLKAEAALRDSEEKFRQLAENIKQLFYIRDLCSNRMLYVSPAYETIWGRSPDKIYADPQDFINSIHPEDKERVLQLISRQNLHGELFNSEYRIFDEQGTIHWIHARSYPILDEHGKLHRIAGIVEDITRRKQTEQYLQVRTLELQQAHDFTSAIVDTVGAVIVVLNPDGKVIRFNHACEHVSGYKAEEVIGHTIWELLVPEYEREAVLSVFKQLSAGDFPNHHENFWLRKDGSKRLLAWSNTCITDEHGNVEYVIGTAVDVTEQRHAEAALRDSAEKYSTLMEYASDIILIAELDGRLIECNSSALKVLGYSRDELLSLQVKDIHPPEQLPRNLADFQTLVKTGSVITNDSALLGKDGRVLPVDINANIIKYQGRKVAVGFMRDIRERKLVEQEQLQAERRYRDMLVREVHHRIKNNLQGVIGLLRNSLSEEQADTEHSERLVARAISQIRTIAMVHGLQAHYRAGEVRVCDITHAIMEQSRGLACDDIHLEYHDNVSQAALLQEEEAIPLALVINEILTNAIKHIPETVSNKQVIVELKGSPNDGMDLTVFNSGAQLPQDLNTDNRNLSGVGLDLIHALLPRQYTHFSLQQDDDAGGVYAKLRIEPGILKPLHETPAATPQ